MNSSSISIPSIGSAIRSPSRPPPFAIAVTIVIVVVVVAAAATKDAVDNVTNRSEAGDEKLKDQKSLV